MRRRPAIGILPRTHMGKISLNYCGSDSCADRNRVEDHHALIKGKEGEDVTRLEYVATR